MWIEKKYRLYHHATIINDDFLISYLWVFFSNFPATLHTESLFLILESYKNHVHKFQHNKKKDQTHQIDLKKKTICLPHNVGFMNGRHPFSTIGHSIVKSIFCNS